jgi:hypothetical protein
MYVHSPDMLNSATVRSEPGAHSGLICTPGLVIA